MDGISVPSRFSCLKIEDEDFSPVANKSKKRVESNKQNVKKISNLPQTNSVKKTVPKQNGTSNSSSKTSTKKNKAKAKQEDKQWEDWKRKDEEFVDENFEQDLQCALFQSKLDFETKKNSVSVVITTQDKNKKKKSKTMSLDQFLENSNQEPTKNSPKSKENKVEDVDNENFFEKAVISAKQELKREKVEEKRRERTNNIEEVMTLVQYQEKLKKEMEKNELLQKDLEDAKKEIILVKKRNKTLCNMLSQGEMKDKAAVLLELEKLTTMKEELTEEVARLHKLLEQERSSTKVNTNSNSLSESHSSTNQNSRHKDKTKKKKK